MVSSDIIWIVELSKSFGITQDFLSGLILGLANKSEDLLFNVTASNFIFGLLSVEASKDIDENSLLITDLTKYISKVIRRIKDAK